MENKKSIDILTMLIETSNKNNEDIINFIIDKIIGDNYLD